MRQLPPTMPTFDGMFVPTIQALIDLGGSANVEEIYTKVTEALNLPEDILTFPHEEGGNQSEVAYRLAWSRTYLKKAALITNSGRGIWSIASGNVEPSTIDSKEILRSVREADKKKPSTTAIVNPSDTAPMPVLALDLDVQDEVLTWHEQLHKVLLSLTPSAFERLSQRLLRESGFIEVEVTGRSSDGGIDGIGIARVSGFLSFRVLFQCKRYQGSISPSQIRDFRGAMMGRTDKGLFITTGTFTREAVKEATRDGAPPIDLIDGEQLVRRLKELNLGVSIKMVEAVEVDDAWFKQL